jgi:MFS family permease
VLIVYAFAFEQADSAVVYCSYALSAYALAVLCAKAPAMVRAIKRLKAENRYVSRYVADVHLRVRLSLYASLIWNTAYAVFQLGLGFYHVWFYALAAYYILLAVMRFFLLREVRSFTPGENRVQELRRYRFCGVVLLWMNLALAVIVFYIAWQNRGFQHHPITTIAMAAYTFTSLTLAIVNVVKYRKYQSPVLSASKAISLAAACVSMLTLETAMLTAFGGQDDGEFRQIITALTGAAVCLLVLIMAVYMIVRSTREIKGVLHHE